VSVTGPGLQEGVPLVGTTPEKLTVVPAGALEGDTLIFAPAALAGDDDSTVGMMAAVAARPMIATATERI
jgi:hypothetical protein